MRTGGLKMIKKLLGVALLVPALSLAAVPEMELDKAPVSMDQASLQHGAKLFVNYCLNCHGASFMRYNRLQDIGLSEDLIRDNLLFTADKVGEPMTIALRREDGKQWFGAAPPDLSVIARAEAARAEGQGTGADWLYTYLRSFYRDPERPTGWNNKVFHNVAMPNVLYELQGEQVAHITKKDDGEGGQYEEVNLELAKPGTLSKEQYDKSVADLVSYLVWMGEPVAQERKTIGTYVLIFLAALFVLTYALKKNYWKDVH